MESRGVELAEAVRSLTGSTNGRREIMSQASYESFEAQPNPERRRLLSIALAGVAGAVLPAASRAAAAGPSEKADADDIAYLTAGEALARFKAKTLSPVELLRAQIKQVEAWEPTLKATTYTYFDEALEQARIAERKYVRGEAVRPLEGITLAIKDYHSVKGKITTYGSRLYKDFVPDQSAPTVERLLAAGAIMHCRTTTPEFAHSGVTASLLWGVTHNPWNPAYTPGGSTGGGGAALAAGYTTLSDGTDGGGSIRIPAAMNGVFGYKPPWGRNPNDREHPNEWLIHYGALARSVGDCGLMQNVTSGQHPADMSSLRDKVVIPPTFDGIAGMRIALSMDLGYFAVDPEVEKNTRNAVSVLRSLGAVVDEVDIGWTKEIEETWNTRWQGVFYALAGSLLTKSRNDVDPYVIKILEEGKKLDVTKFYNLNTVRQKMYASMSKLFETHDALICPTTATTKIVAGRSSEEPLTINGKPVNPFIGWFMTYPFNLVGILPVMSVPTGFDAETSVPTGMQIVGPAYDDLRVFRIASAFEGATRPWQHRRPKLAS
ncbi:amidase [Bradyrhizobium sp. UFLA06-06]